MGLTEYQNICGIEEYLLIFIINVLIIVPTGLGILTYIIIFVDLLYIFITIITNTKTGAGYLIILKLYRKSGVLKAKQIP